MPRTTVSAPAGLPFVDVSREFSAPRDLVFRAFTEPDLLVQWLGPAKYEMVIDEYDVRAGGRWRYSHRNADEEHGFRGVFHGDPSPDGMVQTFEYDGAPGHISLDRLVLEDLGDRTIARTHTVFQSVAARDAMVDNGMEQGMSEGFDRLDELLGRLPVGN